ncbi:PREDICTED: RNA-binding (RRM/RBD/RNP motifs) family [Prunus dulcis]|uniref:PREDICTED: RNA-binding (RRM/RBD/RNP motifs) family n=1 Tax=Prunus dulcis TaxID=3755 RepID=A0A5E4EKE5_PRUDU|nr:uncharacterized protein LOC117634357 [Prunus dulcis]VVA16114.1 PREDICTED: RNA-binding (RRM/RBD/RNP motifs) family [Prunus dulcis]
MSLFRILLPKPGHHLHKRALPKATRWCSSSLSSGPEKPSSSENSEAGKEQRAAAEESNNKYTEPAKGQNKVGESWNSLKGIFSNLKERMLGISRFQKQITVETIDYVADRTISEVIKTKNSPHDTEIDQPNYSIQMPKVIRDSHSCKENISTRLKSDIIRERSSSEVVDATVFNQVDVHMAGLVVSNARKERAGPENVENNLTNASLHRGGKNSLSNLGDMFASKHKEKNVGPKNVEHGVSGNLVLSSETFMDSQNSEKCVRATAASNVTWKRSSKYMGQSEVEPESDRQLGEVMLDNTGVLESETEYQSRVTHQLPGEESRIFQKDVTNGSTVVGNGNHQLNKRTWISDQTPSADTDVDKMPVSSNRSQEVGLANMFLRTMNDQKAGKIPSKKNDTLASNGLLGILTERNETTGEEDMGKGFNINGLIGCIKELPRELLITKPQDSAIPSKTDHIIKRGGSVKKVTIPADSHKHDAKRSESSFRGRAMERETNTIDESEEQPCRGIASLNTDSVSKSDSSDLKVASQKKSKLSPKIHLPTSKEDLNKIPITFSQKEGSTESKVLVRFLHKNVKDDAVVNALNDCGEIVKIQLLSVSEGSNFRDAWVHFKTSNESQRALRKTDLIIGNSEVVVVATSLEDVLNKVSIPNVIGDSELPVALIKNPTRTVMIKHLTHDISLHHLKGALAFCGSGISSFFLGSSSSVAFVEFETEDAKETAIAACSINVEGKQLSILRIDVPRTTVVRISNFGGTVSKKRFQTICNSHGQVKQRKDRGRDIVDVHFKLAEWPNMLTILNSLNGMEVDGNRWLARPAPVFPPEVLQVLWSRPDERIHVISVLRRLLQNTELISPEITFLANKYYKDIL